MGSENRLDQNESMPKVDLLRDISRFKSTDVVYMKRLEKENLKRAKRVQGYRVANNRFGISLALGALGIYTYTIYTFKQEKFLDDFEKPEKTIELRSAIHFINCAYFIKYNDKRLKMLAPRLPPLPSIRDILKMYKLNAVKRLSQNFLLDQNVCNKIIQKAGNLADSHVLEVGPGPGGLTRSIMKQLPKQIVLVEKDQRFEPTLDMLADSFKMVNGKMDIIYDDIRKTHMQSLFPEEMKMNWDDKAPNIFLIGNLPFNVSTPLIIEWLHAIAERREAWAFGRTKMTLTFQKEVAERLVAPESSHQRCRLSVMAQAWTFPVLRFVIPGSVFIPQPDVDVGVVSFTPLVKPRTQHDFEFFEKITRHVFSFRQKYSIRCIETLFPLYCRKELGMMMYKLSDLEPTMRPTQLSVGDIDRLATAYKYLLEKHPELKMYKYRSSRHVLPVCNTKNVVVEDYAEI